MNETTHDVAVIGYGPVGVTAANLLGQMGLRVLVVERDADVYARARAISTDEEVVRIWQRIGLADRLAADMLADRAISSSMPKAARSCRSPRRRGATATPPSNSSTSPRWSRHCGTGSPATRTSRYCSGTNAPGSTRTPSAST